MAPAEGHGLLTFDAQREQTMNVTGYELHMCYGHRLMNYESKCRHLHGHSGRVVLKFQSSALSETQAEQCVKAIDTWIKATLDHTMLLNKADPVLPVLQQSGERVHPMETNPTAEAIAKLIFDYAAAQQFPILSVTIWETATSYATYSK
jgi:6-pyruvoyltetrahydropterin/6-carboxytetrahydropterin synthase